MAFDFGAALTAAGQIAPAWQQAKLDQAEERRRELASQIDARKAQSSSAYQQALTQREQLDRQKGIPFRTYTDNTGAEHEVLLTPSGLKDFIKSPSPIDTQKVIDQLLKDKGISLSPEQQTSETLGLFGIKVPNTPEFKPFAGKAGEPYQDSATKQWKQDGSDASGRTITRVIPDYTPPQKNDAYHEWLSDPTSYDKFVQATAQLKQQKQSVMTPYMMAMMLRTGYNDNPALVPIMGKIISSFLAKQGIPLSPEEQKTISSVPVDQPLSPTTGQPIGSKYPSAPTGATRSQAQVAQRVLNAMPTLRQQVTDAANKLGPAKGRVLISFLLGTVGSTGDPQVDRQLSSLRTHLAFAGSASAKFHINSVRQAELFESMIAAGKSSPEAIQGFLDAVEKWANDTYVQELGYGERGGKNAPPPGAVIRDYTGGPQ